MSDASDPIGTGGNVRRLPDAIRRVRNDLADRDDVVVDLREAQRIRLDLLVQELQDVIADIPDEEASFDLAISSGANPRFWVDSVAHVAMGRDRRTYRFVRDTRMGRVVLAESTDMAPVADAVTRYIAERIVERQRVLESDPVSQAQPEAAPLAGEPIAPRGRGSELLGNLALLLMGIILGAAVTLALLRDRVPELQNLF